MYAIYMDVSNSIQDTISGQGVLPYCAMHRVSWAFAVRIWHIFPQSVPYTCIYMYVVCLTTFSWKKVSLFLWLSNVHLCLTLSRYHVFIVRNGWIPVDRTLKHKHFQNMCGAIKVHLSILLILTRFLGRWRWLRCFLNLENSRSAHAYEEQNSPREIIK